MRSSHLPAACLVLLVFSSCATVPPDAGTPVPAAPPAVVLPPATIRGSEESSALFDNFTAFISAVDGQPIATGRSGWNTPIELTPGRHSLTAEFRRGVFSASARLELQAESKGSYQLKYATDAQVFGHNSFCDFWVVDLATDKPVTGVKKTAVVKGG